MYRPLLFWLSATLLFCNDFIWKSSFHNAFTGKLSDIAGLSLWVLFWEAWLPQRFRAYLYASSALFFVWFKSPLSESFLQFCHLGRVVDYTDLWALLIFLPLYFLPKTPFENLKTWQPTLIGSVVALFLFGATSPPIPKPTICKEKFVIGFKMPKDRLLKFLDNKLEGVYDMDTKLDTLMVNFYLKDSVFQQKYNDYVDISLLVKAYGKDSSTATLDHIQKYRSMNPDVKDEELCSDIQQVLRKRLQMP